MRLTYFWSAVALQIQCNAIPINIGQNENEAVIPQELAQTNVQFIGLIFDLLEKMVKQSNPLDQNRIAQIHGNKFNVLDKDEVTSEWGRTWGQSVQAKGKDKNLMNLVGDLRSPPGNCQ